MPVFEIVCLANSRKRQGRCVAGLRADGQGWLRPIGPNAEGTLHAYHYTLNDSTEARPFDLLRVECSRAHPKPHHPEDWIVMPVLWQLVSRPIARDRLDWLIGQLDTGPHLLGCASDRIAHDALQTRPAKRSLTLIAPERLEWIVKLNEGGERRQRVQFAHGDKMYNLALTDPAWEERLRHLPVGTHPRASAGLKNSDDVWLTISLSEPFAPVEGGPQFCYKLAAAVLELAPLRQSLPAMTGANGARGNGSAQSPAGRRARVLAADPTAYPDPFANDPFVANDAPAPAPPASASPAASPFPDGAGESAVSFSNAAPGLLTAPRHAAIAAEGPDSEAPATAHAVPAPVSAAQYGAPSAAHAAQLSASAPWTESDLLRADVAPRVPAPDAPSEVSSEQHSEEESPLTGAERWKARLRQMRQKLPRAYMPWSKQEDATLRQLVGEGMDPADIAARLQRHTGAVTQRMEKLSVDGEPAPDVAQPASASPASPEPAPAKTRKGNRTTQAAAQAAPPADDGAGDTRANSKMDEKTTETERDPDELRVIVCGAAGRMGREVVKAVSEAQGLRLAAAVDVAQTGADAGELAGIGPLNIPLETDLGAALARTRPHVLIDFTLPHSVKQNALLALEQGVAPVIGTTGLSAADLEALDALARRQGVGAFIAPNFAIGAVLAMQFAAQAARYLPDVEIIELHHEKKLDSPSGTALLTAQKIAQARQEAGRAPLPAPENPVEKAPGARGARHENTGDVPVHSVRLPGFVAHQEVIFGGAGEILTIRHDSMHRVSFMPGVILAARRVRTLQGLVIGLENLL